MSLTPRQVKVYTSLCHVYRMGRSLNGATGAVTETGWTLIASNVPCHYAYTQNDDDPSRIGRLKRRTALTEDELHCEVTTNIRSQDYVRDVTAGGANAGTVHRVMGAARKLPGSGRRTPNKLIVKLMEDEHPPAAVL